MTPPRRRPRARRSGYVLLLVAMLLFGLMAIAAITVDVGLARVTQSKMQAAVDLAALDALRRRDDPTIVDATDPDHPHEGRRLAAALLVDPDIYPPDPTLELGPGLTELNASRLMAQGAVYSPQLELNPDDEPWGDMVGGTYLPNRAHGEVDYTRQDFQPGADLTGAGTALLVRLRRTDARRDVDRDAVPGVSSRGPELPFLFGLGTMIRGADPTDPTVYSPRHHGLTVRATAIADLRPVTCAGRPVAGLAPGFAWLTLAQPYWVGLATTTPVDLAIDGDGAVTVVATGARVGSALPDPGGPLMVGAAPAMAAVFGGQDTGLAWVPVVEDGDFTAALRVVGFGAMEVVAVARGPDPSGLPATLTIRKDTHRAAHANASAVLGAPTDAALRAVHRLFAWFDHDVDPATPDRLSPHTLTAPVLVR